MIATLRAMGRNISDIDAWLTSWDYISLAGTLARTMLEEAPQSLALVGLSDATTFRPPAARPDDAFAKDPGATVGAQDRVPLIGMPHHDNHAWFSFAASPFADDDKAGVRRGADGTGDTGSISLYVVENGEMRRLYCNNSIFDSLGMFYSVISSTQGGWTWLSSEGRYMARCSLGRTIRASNPYYARLKESWQLSGNGEVRLNRAMANWYRDPSIHPYKAPLIDILGEPLKPDQLWKSRCGTARRGHQAPERYASAARQGRCHPARVRGCDDPCGGSPAPLDRREPAGADRRRGAERGRQYAPARTFRCGVLCKKPAA